MGSHPEGVITDPCDGDSGGPLAILRDGRWQLVGVLKVIRDFSKTGGIRGISGGGVQLRKRLLQRRRPVEQCCRPTRVGRESDGGRPYPRFDSSTQLCVGPWSCLVLHPFLTFALVQVSCVYMGELGR